MIKNQNALIFQLMIDEKIGELTNDIPTEKLQELLESIKKEDFGTKGNYTIFCKQCSGSWSFETKDEARFFEHFHKLTGCHLIGKPTTREKKDGKGKKAKIIRVRENYVFKRSDVLVSRFGENKLMEIIKIRQKNSEPVEENKEESLIITP